MSTEAVLARLDELIRQIEQGHTDLEEVDAALAAARAAATGAPPEVLRALSAKITAMGQATTSQLRAIEASIRQVGSVREAVSAYGSAVRPFARGQFVRTQG